MEWIKVNDKEFKIVRLLGKGKGGYSYLVTDGQFNYVVKQIHHEPCEYYNFGNKIESELNDYKKLNNTGIRMPKMLDIDLENERILKEYIDGPCIYDLALENKVKDIYIEQIKEMCSILYPLQINIDYFPTNFIVNNDLIGYIDYECNDYMSEWNFENWGIKYWSRTQELIDYENNKNK